MRHTPPAYINNAPEPLGVVSASCTAGRAWSSSTACNGAEAPSRKRRTVSGCSPSPPPPDTISPTSTRSAAFDSNAMTSCATAEYLSGERAAMKTRLRHHSDSPRRQHRRLLPGRAALQPAWAHRHRPATAPSRRPCSARRAAWSAHQTTMGITSAPAGHTTGSAGDVESFIVGSEMSVPLFGVSPAASTAHIGTGVQNLGENTPSARSLANLPSIRSTDRRAPFRYSAHPALYKFTSCPRAAYCVAGGTDRMRA
jgi:hypothetical protein